MKVKKLLAAALAAVLTVGTLAGCGGKGSSSTGDGKGSGSSSESDSGDIVNLKWVTIGNGMPDNYDSWISKVNDYIGEKIGVNLEMEVVSWGSWDDRRNIIISTNEPYDIIFGIGKNYTSDIELGAYCDITDMIDENMTGLNELMPEECWTAVKVDGRIYGVPTYKDVAVSNYAIWDKELVDEYKLDTSSLIELESLTPTF